MFPASHDFIIQDSKFVNVQGNYHALPETAGLTRLHNLLRKHIAHGASHDSEERSPPPKCHPETRRRVVKDIMDWIGDPVRHSRVLWLNGPAGAGKSAIAQSVSDMYKENKQLAASFFFSRTVPGRNNTKNLFPTITYQLASAIPSLSKIIEGIIEGDPSIFEKSIQIQLERLIVEPLQQLEPDILATMVIIIDGLDECGGEKTQVSLLDLVKFAAERIPVCFLISSRPEAWLQDAFGSSSLQKLTFRLTLDERYNPDTDIRTFLRAEFSRIHDEPRHRHSMSSVSKPWPPDDDIERLVAKASGQFIYASTVLRFVDDPHQHPVDQLKTILGIRATQSSPFAELDQLYRQILSSSPDEERMMKVLRLLFVLVAYGSDIFIDIFFHVPGGVFTLTEKMLMFRPSDIHSSLRGLHSLLLISEPSESDFYNGSLVKFHHASFPDFLTEEHRSKGYFINVASVCGDIAMSCLSIMSNPPINGDQSDFAYWGYCLIFWAYYCARASHDARLLKQLEEFDLRKDWLNVVRRKISRRGVVQEPGFIGRAINRVILAPTTNNHFNSIFQKYCDENGQTAVRQSYFQRTLILMFLKDVRWWLQFYEKPPLILRFKFMAVRKALKYILHT